jgi:CxxC motif-containing protein (DUF1111 family)
MRRAILGGAAALAGLATAAAAGGGLDAAIGERLFRRAWIPAPASTRSNAGLGPLFNARACAACHAGLVRPVVSAGTDGRLAGEALVLRLGDADGRPDPVYGYQVQTSAVPAVPPKAAGLRRAPDGTIVADAPAYGPLASGTRTGALLAPALRGLGALASVPDAAILAGAARSGGRVGWTEEDGTRRPGRFGFRAGAATLRSQVERAFALDLGLSTAGRPEPAGDCPPALAACRAAPHGGGEDGIEIAAAMVDAIAAHLAAVPAPPPPGPDPAGERLFAATGCALCHVPALPGAAGPVRAGTDLLLHDLGPALAGAPEPGRASTEWRTAPLWGLGAALARGAGLLHDGRAATLPDAIALHGGAGTSARDAFAALPADDRARLLAYLESF